MNFYRPSPDWWRIYVAGYSEFDTAGLVFWFEIDGECAHAYHLGYSLSYGNVVMRRILGFGSQRPLPASLRRIVLGGNDAQAQGDAARDRKDWVLAETSYRRHLVASPEDAAIWVQLGHALKESGRTEEAEAAYRSALALAPEDADLHLQIGHLMKLTGRIDQAVQSYAVSARLAPTASAVTELVALGQEPLAQRLFDRSPASPGGTYVYLPISDLLYYLGQQRTVSGIQRVQLELIAYFLAREEEAAGPYRFVYSKLHGKDIWAIAPDRLRELVGYVGESDADHDVIRQLIAAAKDDARPVQMLPGDLYFILGSFWDVGGNAALLRQLKRSNALLGIYFHDLIPITHREYVVRELSGGFAQALAEALSFIDFGLSNSNYTAKEVERFVAENHLRPFPVATVPLAHVFKKIPANDIAVAWSNTIASLQNKKFVLCVGTIEARKNHRYLFDAWKAMIQEGVNPPALVFVGRQGWRVDDLVAQLEATRFLDERISVVHDLSDNELATLYRHCLFTVFPSFVEGWGLPIGESLGHGKLCVASNTSSMPEVGGDLVDYIDPWNLRDGIEVLRNLIERPDEILSREAAIGARFKPRTWSEVGADLVGRIEHFRAQAPAPPRVFRPLLEAATVFRPATFDVMSDRVFKNAGERQQRLILIGDWGGADELGVWMVGRTAQLSFRSNVAPATRVMIYLCFALINSDADDTLTIECSGWSPVSVAVPRTQSSMTVRVEARTGADGDIDILLGVTGSIPPPAERHGRMRVGVESLSYAPLDDGVARAEILESLLIDSQFKTIRGGR